MNSLCQVAVHLPSWPRVQVSVFRFRVSGFGPRVAGIQTLMARGRSTKVISVIKWIRTSRLSKKKTLSAVEEKCWRRRRCGRRCGFWTPSNPRVQVVGFGFWVFGLWFRVSGFGFRSLGVRFRVPGFGFRVKRPASADTCLTLRQGLAELGPNPAVVNRLYSKHTNPTSSGKATMCVVVFVTKPQEIDSFLQQLTRW